MGTFGIVALSLCAGLLLAVFLAGIGVAVYYARAIQKQSTNLEQFTRRFCGDIESILQQHREFMSALTESAKSNFASTRQEMRAGLDLNLKKIEAVLQSHEETMKAVAASINGTQLLEAAKRIQSFIPRLERAVAWIDQWQRQADEERVTMGAIEHPYPESRAEEYGPDSASIYQKARPEDVLGAEPEDSDRLPIRL